MGGSSSITSNFPRGGYLQNPANQEKKQRQPLPKKSKTGTEIGKSTGGGKGWSCKFPEKKRVKVGFHKRGNEFA